MWHVNSVKWQNLDQFIHRKLHVLTGLCVDDLLFDTRNPISSRRDRNDHYGRSEWKWTGRWWRRTGIDAESERIDSQRWTDHSFIKPFRALYELSGSRIERHIQLLLLLAITSSSADRESDELGSTHQEPFAHFHVGRLVFFTDGISFWERCSRMYHYR